MSAITKGPVSAVAAVVVLAGAALFGCCGEVVVEQAGSGGTGGQGGATTGWETVTSTSQGSGGQGGGCAAGWGHVLGGAGSQYARSMAVDGDGSVVTSVQYVYGLALDGVELAGPDGHGFAVVKVHASGAVLWSRVFGEGSGQHEYLPIAVDASSHEVVMGGSFYGTIDIGEGVQATAPGGGGAVLVVKLDTNGHPLWARAFADGWTGARATHLALDAAGNIFLVGALGGYEVDFGSGPLKGDFFLAKLDQAGNPLWAKAFTGASPETHTLAVKSSGAVVLAGSVYDGPVDFGGGVLASAGGFDVFILELDGAGNHVHSARFGDSGLQRAYALTIDAADNLVLAGSFHGAVDFGGGPLESPGDSSSFIAKLDPSGKHLWSKRLPGSGGHVSALAAEPSGEIVAAGSFYGPFDTGCGSVTAEPSQIHAYLARLDAGGTCYSYQGFGSGDQQLLSGVASAGAGRIPVIGGVSGTIDLGAGPIESTGNDGFIATIAPPCEP